MTDISFTPTFKHTAWVDNRDRVAAGGQNGFNVRFDAIQKDLEKLSTVVGVIDTSIKAAGQLPNTPRLLSLAPAFVALPPGTAWSLNGFGVAVRPSASDTDVTGFLNIAPPDGAKLVNFRATGLNSGAGRLAITLFRSPLTGSNSREPLAQIAATGSFGDPVDITSGKEKVEMAAFRYFVMATLAGAADSDTIEITSIQLTYIAN